MTPKAKVALLVLLAVALAVAAHLAFRTSHAEAPAPAATSTTPTTTPATTTAVTPKPVTPAPAATSSEVGRRKLLAGPITEMRSYGFAMRVNDGIIRDVRLDGSTELRRYNEAGTALEPMPVSDLKVGLSVRVIGVFQADGTTLAATVTTGKSATASSSPAVQL